MDRDNILTELIRTHSFLMEYEIYTSVYSQSEYSICYNILYIADLAWLIRRIASGSVGLLTAQPLTFSYWTL